MPSKRNIDLRKSTIIIPSRISPVEDDAEEAEIAAHIHIPEEGAWGWIVVAASFLSIFITDGVFFTFGSLRTDMKMELEVEDSLVALINSIAVAVYFLGGPIVSALINRFGFRACAMCGSVISSSALLCTYFSASYGFILIFYGFINGFGGCLINMTAGIVVGFYFERMRSVAIAISGTGTALGIMLYNACNSQIVKLAGWRLATLFHSSMFGFVYFLSMTYRPLLSFTVTKTTVDPTRTVTYLPNISSTAIKSTASGTKKVTTSPAERLFSAVSNANFPTAASVVKESVSVSSDDPGPSTAAVSKLTFTAQNPEGGLSHRQIKQVQSMISKTSVANEIASNIEVIVKMPEIHIPKKKRFWDRLCHWERHVPESRPMYRDDIFYHGRVTKLDEYQKSMILPPETKTGLEYQMAVSRAVTTADLKERRGVFTTSARRILATMLDPRLLKETTFLCLAANGFFIYTGYLVPYVYLSERNRAEGIDPTHCDLFVSVIGLANAFGRLIIGSMASCISPLKLHIVSSLMTGVATMAFNFSINVYYQYLICVVFGIFAASISCLRSLVVVQLFGLHTLTNATGMLLMFQGIASLLSTPLCGILKSYFGFTVSFYVAGTLMTCGSATLLPIIYLQCKENKVNTKPLSPINTRNKSVTLSKSK